MMKIILLSLLCIVVVSNAQGGPRPCTDQSTFLCKQADCGQIIFLKKCCKTCSGPNPPTRSPTSIFTRPPKNCGEKYVASSRIVGGKDAVPGSWPWQVVLYYRNYRICGGTIVAPGYIATAAHCIPTLAKPKDFIVRVGEHDITIRHEGFEVDHDVSKIIVRGGYSGITRDKDIALLKVKNPIQFNSHVQPACLPLNDVKLDAECYAVGWGKTSQKGDEHTVLKQAKLPIVTNKVCYNLNKRITTKNMLCAGDPSVRSTTCHGDTGGGLVCRTGKYWQLHGILSFGESKCDGSKGYPVFTRVRNFRSWLEDSMAKN